MYLCPLCMGRRRMKEACSSTHPRACYTLVWNRKMIDRIEINPAVMQGKPVIRNTRIPVELVLRKLAEGATTEELLDAYPRLTKDDIRACLAYAANAIAHEEIHSVSSE